MLGLAELPSGGIAIDVGCGNGVLARSASETGARVLGLDLSRETLIAAKRLQGGGEWVRAAADRLPLREGCVDVVLAQHVIEHLHDVPAALEDWRRVLRPGGRTIILTPNHRYPDPAIFDDSTHTRLFAARTLGRALRDARFRVDRTTTLFPYLGGHTVFGLRHRRLFARVPPWSRTGRSLLVRAIKSEAASGER